LIATAAFAREGDSGSFPEDKGSVPISRIRRASPFQLVYLDFLIVFIGATGN
jgi:hypothetical protein